VLDGPTDVLIVDAVPKSLGVMLSGGRLGVLIKKNTQIPCDAVKEYINDSSDKE